MIDLHEGRLCPLFVGFDGLQGISRSVLPRVFVVMVMPMVLREVLRLF